MLSVYAKSVSQDVMCIPLDREHSFRGPDLLSALMSDGEKQMVLPSGRLPRVRSSSAAEAEGFTQGRDDSPDGRRALLPSEEKAALHSRGCGLPEGEDMLLSLRAYCHALRRPLWRKAVAGDEDIAAALDRPGDFRCMGGVPAVRRRRPRRRRRPMSS